MKTNLLHRLTEQMLAAARLLLLSMLLFGTLGFSTSLSAQVTDWVRPYDGPLVPLGASDVAGTSFAMEWGVDRTGSDFRNFYLPTADPKLCSDACASDPKCKAWTYVKPNTIQGKRPRCWLKDSVPKAIPRDCCVSGVKATTGVQPTRPGADPRCDQYARSAISQHAENLRLGCGFTGRRWQSNYDNHYNWCTGVPESSAQAETKARQDGLADCRSRRPGGATSPTTGTSTAILTAEYIGMTRDVVGRGSDATPNGQMDGQFELLLTLPPRSPQKTVTSIMLQSAGIDGSPAGGQVWDTVPNGYWILGVIRNGNRLNPTDRNISDPVQGSADYQVYGNDSGWFKPGQFFRVTVRFSDGSEAIAIADIPAVPPGATPPGVGPGGPGTVPPIPGGPGAVPPTPGAGSIPGAPPGVDWYNKPWLDWRVQNCVRQYLQEVLRYANQQQDARGEPRFTNIDEWGRLLRAPLPGGGGAISASGRPDGNWDNPTHFVWSQYDNLQQRNSPVGGVREYTRDCLLRNYGVTVGAPGAVPPGVGPGVPPIPGGPGAVPPTPGAGSIPGAPPGVDWYNKPWLDWRVQNCVRQYLQEVLRYANQQQDARGEPRFTNIDEWGRLLRAPLPGGGGAISASGRPDGNWDNPTHFVWSQYDNLQQRNSPVGGVREYTRDCLLRNYGVTVGAPGAVPPGVGPGVPPTAVPPTPGAGSIPGAPPGVDWYNKPWLDWRVQNCVRQYLQEVLRYANQQQDARGEPRFTNIDEWGRLLRAPLPGGGGAISASGRPDGNWDNPTHFVWSQYDNLQQRRSPVGGVREYTRDCLLRNYGVTPGAPGAVPPPPGPGAVPPTPGAGSIPGAPPGVDWYNKPWLDWRVQNCVRQYLQEVLRYANQQQDARGEPRFSTIDEWGRLLRTPLGPRGEGSISASGRPDGNWDNPTHFVWSQYDYLQQRRSPVGGVREYVRDCLQRNYGVTPGAPVAVPPTTGAPVRPSPTPAPGYNPLTDLGMGSGPSTGQVDQAAQLGDQVGAGIPIAPAGPPTSATGVDISPEYVQPSEPTAAPTTPAYPPLIGSQEDREREEFIDPDRILGGLPGHPPGAQPPYPPGGPGQVTPAPRCEAVPMQTGSWQQISPHYAPITRGQGGLLLQGGAWTNGKVKEGKMDGNGVGSRKTFDLSKGGDVYMRFKVNGAGKYLGIFPKLFSEASYKLLTTHHSFAGSIVVPENTWLYGHLKADANGRYTTKICKRNYDDQGGACIAEHSGTLRRGQGNARIRFVDNYGGTSAWLAIGEALVCPGPTAVATGPSAPPKPPVDIACDQQTKAGGNQPEQFWVNIGSTPGTVVLNYDMYSVPDRMIVTYENRQVIDTGCVGSRNSGRADPSTGQQAGPARGSKSFQHTGRTNKAHVMVKPSCAGGSTKWTFNMKCPTPTAVPPAPPTSGVTPPVAPPAAPPPAAVPNFAGNWHSPRGCDEVAEPAFKYRWNVSLTQQGDNVLGTIYFHKCSPPGQPGGGRAIYDVSGKAKPGQNFVQLKGRKSGGRGGLFGSAPSSPTFTIRRGQAPQPNLAP